MAKGAKTGGGSRKGVPNKCTAEFRETVRKLLEDNSENVARWLSIVAEGGGSDGAKPDPAKALNLICKLAEYAAPKLNRTEHTGPNGGPVEHRVSTVERRIVRPADRNG